MRQKINPIATENGRFKDGNPATGEYGTVVTAEHMNNVQDAVRTNQGEILTVLREAGIAPNETDETQLWQALQVISGQVESIEALRQFEPLQDRQLAYVKGYYTGTAVGGGQFYFDEADTTSADNGGTVIVTASGKRWKRVNVGRTLSIVDFGAVGDYESDCNDSLKSCLFAASQNGASVLIPNGVFGLSENIEIPNGVSIYGEGAVKIAPFPQRSSEKDKLQEGKKHLISGSVLVFKTSKKTGN